MLDNIVKRQQESQTVTAEIIDFFYLYLSFHGALAGDVFNNVGI